jgi:hypothetical protein
VCDWYFDTQNNPATRLPNADNIEMRMDVRDTTLRSGMARNATAALHCDGNQIDPENRRRNTYARITVDFWE